MPDSAHSHYPNLYTLTNKRQSYITIDPENWTQIYSNVCPPSNKKLYTLDLSNTPIVIRAGQVRGIYIHSTLPSDKAIVYDKYSQYNNRSFDSNIRILPAMAHLSNSPFSYAPLWEMNREAWRYQRKFVGQIDYDVLYKLWNPSRHFMFGEKFQCLTMTLFASQRRPHCVWSLLSDECIFYILTMCKWDWGGDDANDMVEYYKQKKEKAQNEALERLKEEEDSYDSSEEIFMSDYPILYQESEDDDFDLLDIRRFDYYEIVVTTCTSICVFTIFAGVSVMSNFVFLPISIFYISIFSHDTVL